MSDIDRINKLMTDALASKDALEADVGAEATRRMLGNVKARMQAAAPAGTYTIPALDDWEPFDQGIDRRVLHQDQGDGIETVLYRLVPGARFVSHPHTQQETCWVVKGEILVGDGHAVHAGDFHVAEPGYDHPEIVARSEALLLIRSQINVGPLTPR